MNAENSQYMNLGKWVGRGQAFAVTANHSLFALAKIWKEVHDTGDYKRTGLSWDEFCSQEIGLSRQAVDTAIKNLETHGEAFFRIAQIVPVSPGTFQALAARIEDGSIEIEGEIVPIAPQNAARIRAAVVDMRSQLARAQAKPKPAKDPVKSLNSRLQGCLTAIG